METLKMTYKSKNDLFQTEVPCRSFVEVVYLVLP